MTLTDGATWDRFVASYPEANFLQSSSWGELHKQLGMVVIRKILPSGGGYQAIVKDAKRGRYLEVPGAPLVDWSNAQAVSALVDDLKATGKQHDCVFVRIRPQLIDTPENRACLQSSGLRKAPMHLHAEHTTILDLTKPEDTLLEGMRRQTRYEVKRATKQGIVVSWSNSAKVLDEFFSVQAETAQRQGFIPPSKSFLDAQRQAFGDALRIYRAEKDGKLLNLALIVFYGEEADYHEAASTPESRSYAGAYAIQWQVIRDAKQKGISRYNFWGIAYSSDPSHRYAGVTTFKRGFGGDDVTYVPAHDIVLSPRYLKNWIIETIRRKKRKL